MVEGFLRGTYMERSWMQLTNIMHPEYQKGVQEFLQFAFANTTQPGSKIRCPCIKCYNCYFRTREQVEDHLQNHGIVKNYVKWEHHVEDFQHGSDDDDSNHDDNDDEGEVKSDDEMKGLIIDLAAGFLGDSWGGNESRSQSPHVFGEEANTSVKLLRDAQSKLYSGCDKFSNLSFIVKLLHSKIIYCRSKSSFDMHLELFKDALPKAETLPGSYDEAKEMIQDFNLQVVKEQICSTGDIPASPCKQKIIFQLKTVEINFSKGEEKKLS